MGIEIMSSGREYMKIIFTLATLCFVSGIALGVISFIPTSTEGVEEHVVIDDLFKMTPNEVRRHTMGLLRTGDKVYVTVKELNNSYVDYRVATYGRIIYSNRSSGYDQFVFIANSEYYEVYFHNNESTSKNVSLLVSFEREEELYLYSWLGGPSKLLFFSGWTVAVTTLIWLSAKEFSKSPVRDSVNPVHVHTLRRKLIFVLLIACIFWLIVLCSNFFSPLGLEGWYTDHARHPYSAYLFTKYGLSIFRVPLGQLASIDDSFYKFITWTEMPHLYPLGSVFLFLPFGLLLQAGIPQDLVLKAEIALFLVLAHACVYHFTKHLYMRSSSKVGKAVALYGFYYLLILYSANGMFDALPIFFSLLSVIMLTEGCPTKSIFYAVLGTFFKYQVGIFLMPLILMELSVLYRKKALPRFLKSGTFPIMLILTLTVAYTAYLNIPFLANVRPELVMNGIYVFSHHPQLHWHVQLSAVLLTLSVTFAIIVYFLRKGCTICSMLLFYALFPGLSLPYFQQWYFPYLYIYLLIPWEKRSINFMALWLIAVTCIITLGNFMYDPIWLLDRLNKVISGFSL